MLHVAEEAKKFTMCGIFQEKACIGVFPVYYSAKSFDNYDSLGPIEEKFTCFAGIVRQPNTLKPALMVKVFRFAPLLYAARSMT